MIRIGGELVKLGHKVSLMSSKLWIESKNGAGKFSSSLQGVTLVPIDDGCTDNAGADIANIQKVYGLKLPYNVIKKLAECIADACVAPLQDLHATQPIDYAVVDFFGGVYAKQLAVMGVDFCVNLPGPANVMYLNRVVGTEDWSWMSCGERIENFLLKNLLLGALMKAMQEAGGTLKPWLVNSFEEIDNHIAIPSHTKYCGSLGTSSTGEALEGDFGAFFKKAEEAGLPVVCVSLGSMVRPDKVISNAIYNGLVGGPWFVVWSLYDGGIALIQKELGEKQEIDTNRFLMSKWIPQAAILAHPQCKLFITHGGWGGLMEAAASGKPVLCLPFFGDQPNNAKLVVQSGWGLSLPDQKMDPTAVIQDPPTWKGKLTATEVSTKVTRILNEASFQKATLAIKTGVSRYGGRSAAAKQIDEWAKASKQGSLPKPVKARARGLGACCAALCG